MSAATLLTADQFGLLQSADTEDYELIEGELTPFSSATPNHARIRRLIERAIEDYLARYPIGEVYGEVDCRVGETSVRRPDVSIFLGDPIQQIDRNKIPIPFAPDIAVEVLSVSESATDVRRKVRDYLRAGSREVWILDHLNAEILVYTEGAIRAIATGSVLESPLLPGFSAPVANLLAA